MKHTITIILIICTFHSQIFASDSKNDSLYEKIMINYDDTIFRNCNYIISQLNYLKNYNHINSINALSWFYKNGICVKKNSKKSFKLLNTAVNIGGNEYTFAEIGHSYKDGIGVKKNADSAFKYLFLGRNISSGASNLAWCFYKGIGVMINNDSAFYYNKYSIQIDSTNKFALNNIGACFENGQGTIANNDSAFYYYKKSADYGESQAIINLANCYIEGIGTIINTKLGFELILSEAKKNNIIACKKLSEMYYYGIGTDKNLEDAKKWKKMK